MNALVLPFMILSLLNGMPEPICATLQEIRQSDCVFAETSCLNPDEKRLKALNRLKSTLDRVTPMEYGTFYWGGLDYTPEQLEEKYAQYPGFYAYDRAFERVLQAVKTDIPEDGQVFLWHVYNMGYVVRTPKTCFAIDLHHRRSEELVPFLDFCCVTHHHSDHYTQRFLDAMKYAGKTTITNFDQTDIEKIEYKKPTGEFVFDDVKVITYASDHNASLLKFVMPMEIICSNGDKACVIFTSGDSCNPNQLAYQSDHINFWIVHPYVGLNVADGAEQLNPQMTLVSHLMECHHYCDKWRWTWRQGYDAAKKIWETGRDAIVPVWGDKIVFPTVGK